MRKEILISIVFSIFSIVNYAYAEKEVNIAYTIINNFSGTYPNSLARVIFYEDNIVKSLPLKIFPVKSFNKYFAYSKLKQGSASRKSGFIYFEGSSLNTDFGFYNFENLSGNLESLKERLREEIEEDRKTYSKKLEEENELTQAIVRLRKDARLIAGYDKIELLQKEKAKLGYKIEEVRNKKQFLEKIIASTQESDIPRNYQNRLEELIEIIKNLAKAEGGKVDLEEIFSTAYADGTNEEKKDFNSTDTASTRELSSELEYLIQQRRELEKYFGYEQDEFSMGIDF